MPEQTHWYDILKASSHEKLIEIINEAAKQGWEPVQCWSDRAAGQANSFQAATDHFVLVRLPVPSPATT